jgi:Zn-dependent protease
MQVPARIKQMALAFLVVFGRIVCVCLHEFGHAIVAYAGGDDSVRSKGYLTLNFLRYIDPVLSLVFPALILSMGGIGLPGAAVYINESKLRNRFWRSAVAAAGPLTTFLCTWIISLVIVQNRLVLETWVYDALSVIVLLNIATTFLNLAPLPPLDGYGIIQPWLPEAVQQRIRAIPPVLAIVVILVLFSFVPPVADALWSTSFEVLDWLDVSRRHVSNGYQEFRQNSMAVVLALLFGTWLLSRRKKPSQGSSATPTAG